MLDAHSGSNSSASLHEHNIKEETNLSSKKRRKVGFFISSFVGIFIESLTQQPVRVFSDNGLQLALPSRSPKPHTPLEEANLASQFTEAKHFKPIPRRSPPTNQPSAHYAVMLDAYSRSKLRIIVLKQ